MQIMENTFKKKQEEKTVGFIDLRINKSVK